MKNRICVAMSGGVDSSACAVVLKNRGHDVFGLTMNLLGEEIFDAKDVCDKLGLEHHFIDYTKEFDECVIDYFKQTYLKGETPSPCVMCNRYIKLGLLIDKAVELGANRIVTGHYAIIKDGHLYASENTQRDQSYFLCLVKKENLSLIEFPLENLSKDETRKIVKDAGLEIYKKPDSQDICFIKDGKYSQMFDEMIAGNIVDVNGKIVGKHKGIINHTVGQRKGLGVGGFEAPQYVVAINADKNEVVIGEKECLKTTEVFVSDVNLLEEVSTKFECQVKLRSKQERRPAVVELLGDGNAKITLLEPDYGVAAGQVACFYGAENIVLGGAIIKSL